MVKSESKPMVEEKSFAKRAICVPLFHLQKVTVGILRTALISALI